jgi:hypothetical protein
LEFSLQPISGNSSSIPRLGKEVSPTFMRRSVVGYNLLYELNKFRHSLDFLYQCIQTIMFLSFLERRNSHIFSPVCYLEWQNIGFDAVLRFLSVVFQCSNL